jgi:plasmid maintenance system antidote protein VapI
MVNRTKEIAALACLLLPRRERDACGCSIDDLQDAMEFSTNTSSKYFLVIHVQQKTEEEEMMDDGAVRASSSFDSSIDSWLDLQSAASDDDRDMTEREVLVGPTYVGVIEGHAIRNSK